MVFERSRRVRDYRRIGEDLPKKSTTHRSYYFIDSSKNSNCSATRYWKVSMQYLVLNGRLIWNILETDMSYLGSRQEACGTDYQRFRSMLFREH